MRNKIVDPLLKQLQKARKRSGLNQSQVSSMIDLPQSYLSSIENGKHDVRLSTFVDLAKTLNFDVILSPREMTPALRHLIAEFNGEAPDDERAFIPTGDSDD